MAGPHETRPEAAGARVAVTSRVPHRAYAVATAIAVLVAGIGGLATDLGPWYRGLLQPPWKPPDLVFGPVWTLLYTLTAWAGARAWWHARPALQADEAAAEAGRRRQRRLLAGFLLNALLNVLWSVLFFKAQRPDWALVEIVLLTASVFWLISACAEVDRLAARLLLPYLAWVLFAATVNAGVLRLNPVAPGA
jgi:tryptophan-rich sensory protein